MKMRATVAVIASLSCPLAQADSTTPVSKVLQLMSDLQAKIVKEGADAQKVYEEAAEWCEDRSKDLQFQIKTGKAESAELNALIDKETAKIGALNAKIEKLTASMSEGENNLKKMTAIRNKEHDDFKDEEKELNDVISMLTRAIGILQREMAKGGASALQLQNTDSITKALSVLVEASGFRNDDVAKLTALVQSAQSTKQADGDQDEDAGAPDAAVYENHSGDIIQTMEDLLEKAKAQLNDARTAETNSRHNYDMMKQSIDDELKFGRQDLDKAKKGLAESTESKSTATGDLAATTKALNEDTKALAELHQDCMAKAQDYEAEVQSRADEMNAVTKAKKVIAETTSGAAENTYGGAAASFLQTKSSGSLSTHVVRLVRNLAAKQNSKALMQLSHKMQQAVSAASKTGADPFSKVKGLIADMIERLEDDAQADAEHHAYCEKEMAETREKDEDKSDEIEKLTTQIDQQTSAAARLREEIALTQKALAKLAASQANMNKIREEEHGLYVTSKADLEQGLTGVQLALKVLREYYSAADDADHSAATGAGAGIIGLLEVVESDFTKNLAETNSAEASAAAAYKKETDENEVENAAKTQDVKYKSAEVTSLEKATQEATTDRQGVQSELEAVREYMASLRDQCISKPETYEVTKARREAEIAGLKDALATLEGQSLIQEKSSRRLRHNLRATK